MNKPSTTIASYSAPKKYRRGRHHCPGCHPKFHLVDNNLNALERYALNRTYNRESDLKRLERLENLAFGAIQGGDLNTRYYNVENAILSRPQSNVKRSIIGNIANYFSGQATGFTPSLNTFGADNFNTFGGFSTSPYAMTPRYSNNGFEQYSNGIFGGGWGISGNDFGTGSSVKILD